MNTDPQERDGFNYHSKHKYRKLMLLSADGLWVIPHIMSLRLTRLHHLLCGFAGLTLEVR